MEFTYNFNSSSRYTFKKPLGAGGSADVFLYTRHIEGMPDQEVVLKVFKNKNPEAINELINEGVRLSEFKHPYILNTLGYEKINSNTFALILEYIPGKNLREILPDLQINSRPAIASYVIKAVAGAILTAHSQKIIHGDLSSRNVLVSQRGQIKLSDFGQARRLGVPSPLKGQKGSIDYLAPERWHGEPTSREADIFALGVLALEILSGQNLLREKDLKKFFKTQPWKMFPEWQKFFALSLSYESHDRGPIDEIIKAIPHILKGQEELGSYLSSQKVNREIEKPQNSTTTIFLNRIPFPRMVSLSVFKAMLITLLLVTSVAIGVDHNIREDRIRPSLLTVTSLPWGEVLIDGSSVGYTPILNFTLKAGVHTFLWQDRDGLKVKRTIMNYGNGLFAYQIIKNKGRPVRVAPLMREN